MTKREIGSFLYGIGLGMRSRNPCYDSFLVVWEAMDGDSLDHELMSDIKRGIDPLLAAAVQAVSDGELWDKPN